MLPHHPPEVGEGRGDGSLSRDVGIGMVVALGKEEEGVRVGGEKKRGCLNPHD